jgi:DHA2 family methylenomycin A resistance protein-like MFS transporter
MSPHQRATLAVTCVGFFMVLLDVSIVNTALPSIQRNLHASLSELQWVVDGYTLAFAVLLLTWGSLADRLGRKRFFQAGMAVFTLGSLLCGLAASPDLLNAARALQGVGGAALAPTSLALLATAFPEPKAKIRAIALWAAISGIALGIGPTVGGLLVDGWGWRSVFFVNVPVGVACLVFGVRALRESKDPAARRIDLPGQLLSIAWLGALTYGFIERGTHPWGAPEVAVPLLTGVLLLVAFLGTEARSPEPMLPLSLFGSRLFSATAGVTFMAGFALISLPFFIAQYFQDVQGLSAIQSGLRVLAFTLMFSLLAPLAGRLSARFGFRLPVALGGLTAGTGMLLLGQITPSSPYRDVAWRLALCGIGFGLMLSPLSASALASVDPRRAGLASSAANTARQTGTVVGIALLGALVQNRSAASAAGALNRLAPGLRRQVAAVIAHGGGAPASVTSVVPASHIHQVAGAAFVSGIGAAYTVDGVVLVAAGVIAALFLRERRATRSTGQVPGRADFPPGAGPEPALAAVAVGTPD